MTITMTMTTIVAMLVRVTVTVTVTFILTETVTVIVTAINSDNSNDNDYDSDNARHKLHFSIRSRGGIGCLCTSLQLPNNFLVPRKQDRVFSCFLVEIYLGLFAKVMHEVCCCAFKII